MYLPYSISLLLLTPTLKPDHHETEVKMCSFYISNIIYVCVFVYICVCMCDIWF